MLVCEWLLVAGLFGVKWFLMALADGGMNDLAYEVLTTPSYPGYRWMMNNLVDTMRRQFG